jgi:hypothetical protein
LGSIGREAIEENERKMRRWVCCVFFTETKQNVLFGLCEKNTANPISVTKA